MNIANYSTWLEIDLGAVRNNVRRMKAITGRGVIAVIKGNGYGHGLVEMGRAVSQAGADYLAVARIEEALPLRQAGITTPVLVLGYITPAMAEATIANEISFAVYDPELAQIFAARAAALGKPARMHVKIDSGMGRLGKFPEDGVDFIRWLKTLPGAEVEGLFTHFARSDEPAHPFTNEQIACFTTLVKALEENNLRPRVIHAANSAAALYFPAARFDMVRSGIALCGLHPDEKDARLPDDFETALTWKARLTSVKILPPGHCVGYMHRYVTTGTERIGAISAGYADGLPRRVGNPVIVGGKRVKVVGGTGMDQCMVPLDSIPDAQVGHEVVLIGRQGEARLTAEEVGAEWGTNNYDVVCGLQARLPRVYFNRE